jgi:hypothetical protein
MRLTYLDSILHTTVYATITQYRLTIPAVPCYKFTCAMPDAENGTSSAMQTFRVEILDIVLVAPVSVMDAGTPSEERLKEKKNERADLL